MQATPIRRELAGRCSVKLAKPTATLSVLRAGPAFEEPGVAAASPGRRRLLGLPQQRHGARLPASPHGRRGPSQLTPGILKPDILAPGVNILAGMPTEVYRDRNYAFLSGTSMAAPHVSGIMARMKNKNPTWSPAIIRYTVLLIQASLTKKDFSLINYLLQSHINYILIRSALMTTADVDGNRSPGMRIMDQDHVAAASYYAIGAGHVNLTRAMDPGLAYNVDEAQYASFLCTSLGDGALRVISGNASATCSGLQPLHQTELNYPSVVVDPAPVGSNS